MTDDESLAHVIGSLFHDCARKPRGKLSRDDKRERLMSDPALAVYFASVTKAGEDAWRKERASMGHRMRGTPPEERGAAMSLTAIVAMLPTWRYWGWLVIDAGEAPDLDTMFWPPG